MSWVKTASLLFIVLFASLLGLIWTQSDSIYPTNTPGGDSTIQKTGLDPDDPGPSFYPEDIPSTESKHLYSERVAYQITNQINRIRDEEDLPPLTTNRTAGSVARAHSWDMFQNDHTRRIDSNGDSPSERYTARTLDCRGVQEITHRTSTTVTRDGSLTGVTSNTVSQKVVSTLLVGNDTREKLLAPDREIIGVGVVITERTPPEASRGIADIYITIDLCG